MYPMLLACEHLVNTAGQKKS